MNEIKVGDLYKMSMTGALLIVTKVNLRQVYIYDLKHSIQKTYVRSFVEKIINEQVLTLLSRADELSYLRSNDEK